MKKIRVLFLLFCLPVWLHANPISEPASLREQLPQNTVAYLRMPSVWGFLSSPKKNALHAALSSKANVKAIAQIENAFFNNFLNQSPLLKNNLTALLLHHLRSPIEVAVILAPNTPPMFANTLFSAKMDFESDKTFKQFFSTLIEEQTDLQVIAELDENGYGALMLSKQLPISLRYEATTRTLNLMAGATTTLETLKTTLASLEKVEHPMHVLESQLDTSAQGFFLWVDSQKILLPLSKMGMSEKDQQILQAFGAMDIEAIALGCGTRDEKSRLQFILQGPKTGYHALLPIISNQFQLTTAGTPRFVGTLSLPLTKILKLVEKIVMQEASEEKVRSYQAFKQKFQEKIGLSLEETLSALGSEIIFFADEMGEYLALRLDNKEAFQKLLQTLTEKLGLPYGQRKMGDLNIHHLKFSYQYFLKDDQLKSQKELDPAISKLIFSMNDSYFYWLEQDGYLIFATVPQALIDRGTSSQQVILKQWFQQSQKQNVASALFSVSTNINNVPRYIYYTYLNGLNYLASITEAEIDLFSLPSARQLNLPTQGTYGIQMNVSETMTGIEFTFENNPLEFLAASNGMASIAVVGILAAVAIPAYTDYMKRSKVMSGLSRLSRIKTPAEEFYGVHQRLPTIEEISGRAEGTYVEKFFLLEAGNGYGAIFKDKRLAGTLMLIYDEEAQTWLCTSEGMKLQYLPAACRN